MNRCKEVGARWAIFSDYHGVWFGDEMKPYYSNDEGDPNNVDEQKFQQPLKNFDERLADYDEVLFYHNPGRFHRIYILLVQETSLRPRLTMISHRNQII